jgi:hypothetical protein
MRRALRHHPDTHCDAVSGVAVEIDCPQTGELSLTYVVEGRIGDLALQLRGEPGRSDGLWQHSCFEAFLREGHGPAYLEYNFAPARQWAAYRFDDYRSGQHPADVAPPRIEVRADVARLEMRVVLALPGNVDWHLGLSAVIEEEGGVFSYWALVHPPGKPDFHHSDCFALDLAAAWRP